MALNFLDWRDDAYPDSKLSIKVQEKSMSACGLQVCDDDAYETYSIPTPERCLLGRNVTSTRRKADAACFNGRGWQREMGWDEHCECGGVSTDHMLVAIVLEPLCHVCHLTSPQMFLFGGQIDCTMIGMARGLWCTPFSLLKGQS